MSQARIRHAQLLRLLAASPVILAMFSAQAAHAAHAANEQATAAKPEAPAAAQEKKDAPAAKPQPPQQPAAKPAAGAAPQKLQQVEVTGSAQQYDDRRNDTATKIVITQEEILKNGDTTISDVLKRLPGMTTGGAPGRGGAIRMRGLGNGYTQIMINGDPAPPGFSIDSISPDNIERIEILRAATAEHTTQAVAGGINIVLKRAVQTGQRELRVYGQVDNGKPGAGFNLQIADRKGPLSYSIGGGGGTGKQDRLPTQLLETQTDPTGKLVQERHTTQKSSGEFNAINISPRINLALGPGDILTSQSFITANRFTGHNSDRTATVLGPLPSYSGNDYSILNDMAIVRSDLTWTRKLEGGAKLDAKFGVNWNKRDTNVGQALLDVNGSKILERDVDSGATDKGYSASGKYSTPFAEDHALAFGWDAGVSDRAEERHQRDISTAGVQTFKSDEVFDASVKRLALFAQDEWNVTKNWSLYLGMRWEGLDTTSQGNTYASIHNKSSVLSPILQTLYKLPDMKNDQIRFAITRTYRAPNTSDLIPRRFTSNNNSVTSPDQMGNPNLKPELAWGLDASYEHFLPGGGLLSASTFVRRIENIIHKEITLQNGLWVSSPTNAGTATTRGIELEAKLPLRALDKELPAIDFRANVSRNWSTISNVPGPNNRLDQQTPFSGNIGADWKLDTLPLTLGGNFNFQAGGPVRITEQQSAWQGAKRTMDAYGLWTFDPKTKLRVALSNVLKQDNVNESFYNGAFGTAHSQTTIQTTMVLRAFLEKKF